MSYVYYPSNKRYITTVAGTHIEINAHRSTKGDEDLAKLYKIEILINGEELSLPLSLDPRELQSVRVRQTLQVIRTIFACIDSWGQNYPYTFWSIYNKDLYRLRRTLAIQGFIGDDFCEQWIIFYGTNGEKTAFAGMLNLMVHQIFDAPYLWRIAKYSHFYTEGSSNTGDWTMDFVWDHPSDPDDDLDWLDFV